MSKFQMKQFSITQTNTAMKVGTDAVLLGSWAEADSPSNGLDIGSGTGILSLMLTQRYPNLRIKAVEIEDGAVQDAEKNFLLSPYRDRLELIKGDITQLASGLLTKSVDLIISNPPYFDSSIVAPEQERATARHEGIGGLTLEKLMRIVNHLLAPQGVFCLISPTDRMEDLRKYATQNLLFPDRITTVSSSPNREVRTLSRWRRLRLNNGYEPTEYGHLVLRDSSGAYTQEYKTLVTPYLTNL